MDVEIITVGFEILDGDVLDTNSNWMAKKISRSGNCLRRVTIIEDLVGVIASTLREALARSPSLIIISGGLGPTRDDLTLEGVSNGLGVGLAEDGDAVEMIANAYARWNEGKTREELLTGPRRKMGMLPVGSTPLENPVGTAPGVLCRSGETTVVCLPGVPAELRGLFNQSVMPLLGLEAAEEQASVVVRGIGESELADHLNAAMAETGVEIRSYPSKGKIRLKIIGDGTAGAIKFLRKSLGEGRSVKRLVKKKIRKD